MKSNKFFSCGIVGITGFGKTYLTNKIQKKFNRVIVVDPQSQFDEINKSCVESLIESVHQRKRYRIRCYFDDFEDYARLFYYIYEYVEDVLLVIDEISLFTSSYNSDEYLRHIVQRGRAKNISLVWNTQRPASVSNDLYSQTWILLAFRLDGTSDMRKLPYIIKEENLTLMNQKVGEYKILRGKEFFDRLKIT